MRVNLVNYVQKDKEDDKKTQREESKGGDDDERGQCLVELKEKKGRSEEEEEESQEKDKQIEENDVCECNVKCIENCQNIQLGTEGLPVIYLDTNRYMIEINEKANIPCE